MKIEIKQEKKNPLLKRKELIIDIIHEHASTPSKANLQAFLAKELGAEQEKIEISKIMTNRGSASSTGYIKIWDEKKVGIEKSKAKKEAKLEKREIGKEDDKKEEKKEVKEEKPSPSPEEKEEKRAEKESLPKKKE